MATIQGLLTKKYGLQFRVLSTFAAVFRRGGTRVGIEITVP